MYIAIIIVCTAIVFLAGYYTGYHEGEKHHEKKETESLSRRIGEVRSEDDYLEMVEEVLQGNHRAVRETEEVCDLVSVQQEGYKRFGGRHSKERRNRLERSAAAMTSPIWLYNLIAHRK